VVSPLIIIIPCTCSVGYLVVYADTVHLLASSPSHYREGGEGGRKEGREKEVEHLKGDKRNNLFFYPQDQIRSRLQDKTCSKYSIIGTVRVLDNALIYTSAVQAQLADYHLCMQANTEEDEERIKDHQCCSFFLLPPLPPFPPSPSSNSFPLAPNVG
jgi:hypothetical protein